MIDKGALAHLQCQQIQTNDYLELANYILNDIYHGLLLLIK